MHHLQCSVSFSWYTSVSFTCFSSHWDTVSSTFRRRRRLPCRCIAEKCIARSCSCSCWLFEGCRCRCSCKCNKIKNKIKKAPTTTLVVSNLWADEQPICLGSCECQRKRSPNLDDRRRLRHSCEFDSIRVWETFHYWLPSCLILNSKLANLSESTNSVLWALIFHSINTISKCTLELQLSKVKS